MVPPTPKVLQQIGSVRPGLLVFVALIDSGIAVETEFGIAMTADKALSLKTAGDWRALIRTVSAKKPCIDRKPDAGGFSLETGRADKTQPRHSSLWFALLE
jgi:hypothetical protein